VFNPLTPAEVVLAIGQAARGAARGEGGTDEYARGQLLSAYSVSRHLSVELESYAPELHACASDLARWSRTAGEGDCLDDIVAQLERTAGAADLGDATCALLERLRGSSSDAAGDLMRRIHARLRQLAEREVEMLAEVIEGAT
jgi:hypothetical protein